MNPRAVRGIDAANDAWGCNCGPSALAAALDIDAPDVRAAVCENGKFRGYMGVLAMRKAIPLVGSIRHEWSRPDSSVVNTIDAPAIVLIQFGGPWMRDPRAAAKHRHFVAHRNDPVDLSNCKGQGWTFDANNPTERGATIWIPTAWWSKYLLPDLAKDHEGGDGTITIQWMATVGKR